jgi:hypothetical protein
MIISLDLKRIQLSTPFADKLKAKFKVTAHYIQIGENVKFISEEVSS